MPTGRQRGFTYLLLLFVLALLGAGLATLGQRWQTLAQRERETELLFRAGEIRRAIEGYVAASPDGALPRSLEQLLEDQRSDPPRHHLRRLYADPFTTQADWLLLRQPDGGIQGLRSRSRVPALRRAQLPVSLDNASTPVRVGDWRFVIEPAAAPPPPTTTPDPGRNKP
jgi:type II secretory pathway pseudopilin PulG